MKIMERMSNKIIALFVMMSTFAMADANSDAFREVFNQASKQGGSNVIEKTVNSLFYGLMIMYRGVATKVSQLTGYVVIGFIIMTVLGAILRNLDKGDVHVTIKEIIPALVKNIIIATILIVPTTYKIGVGLGGSMLKNETMRGTILTRIVEAIYTMYYRLGLIFFGDSLPSDTSPGKLASMFFTKPLNSLQKVFGLMAFFSVFTNIAKIVLLIFCLWICGKMIAIYIANIFMSLMLTTFAIFYLIFLTLDGTQEIGQKGVRIIITQSITMFMTVAMMGLAVQVIGLVSTGESIQGIASLTMILMMLEQTMENIGTLASAITSGGSLGASNGSQFMGLAGTLGAMIGGLAMMGGAKMDEITEKKENKEKDALDKAMKNVGGAPTNNELKKYDGIKDGAGEVVAKKPSRRRIKAEDSERAYKKMRETGRGMGAKAGLAVALFMQGATGDLNRGETWQTLGSQLKDAMGNPIDKNYPYNVLTNSARERIYDIGYEMFLNNSKYLFNELKSPPLLNPELASINSATKGNSYYENEKSKKKRNNISEGDE